MVQYNEAGVSQKGKNSTHRVAMVSEDDDASADRQSSSCSCASARPTCWPTGTVPRVTDRKRRLTDRHGRSRHWPEASTERPPLVVDHVLSFWTAWSRRPLTVVLYRSCRRPRAVVLTNVADEHVRWRRRTAGVHVAEQLTGDEDTYRRRLRPMTEGVEANVHTVDALLVGDYGGWWWWLMGVTTNACYR